MGSIYAHTLPVCLLKMLFAFRLATCMAGGADTKKSQLSFTDS